VDGECSDSRQRLRMRARTQGFRTVKLRIHKTKAAWRLLKREIKTTEWEIEKEVVH
jgi:hypothetical protein